MITFANWRNVGRAMRWARQQAHIRTDVSTIASLAVVTDNRWRWAAGGTVTATHAVGYDRTDVEIRRRDAGLQFYGVQDAAEVLRVLAALNLIPDEIAHAPEERYGRCVRCGRLAQWSPPSEAWPGRWFHVRRVRFDQDPHLAEVAE